VKASEHALQVAVAHMLQLVLDPDLTWWSAIDHGVGKLSRRSAGMMKARGVKAGLPDFIIMAHVRGRQTIMLGTVIGIELKTDTGKLSPSQREVADAWLAMGHKIYVARSLEEVQAILEYCHIPLRRRMNFLGGGYERPQRPTPARHSRPRRPRKSKNHLPLVLARAAQKD
jgi:hypothetical protein